MKLAQIQMRVGPDKAANLRHAETLLARAADADMAVLPEMFCCPYDNACFRAYGEPEGGPAYQMLSRAGEVPAVNSCPSTARCRNSSSQWAGPVVILKAAGTSNTCAPSSAISCASS